MLGVYCGDISEFRCKPAVILRPTARSELGRLLLPVEINHREVIQPGVESTD